MRITVLTQDEPFYLAESLDYLIKNLPKEARITSVVLFDVSPFGKKESFITKAKKTYSIFGLHFFIYYSFKYIFSFFKKRKKIPNVLKKHKISKIRLSKSVNHRDSLDIIKSHEPDLLISIAGNQIFKLPLINLAPKGCLNLHTALLPKYRGLMPTFWVLKNNEKHTGVSVFFVDEGIDSGPILVQKKVEIGNMTQEQLIRKTKKMGMEAIAEGIEKIISEKYELIENPAEEKTYYTFPTKNDVKEFKSIGKRFF
ncbi:formyltransferase family protein [uncultured Aquimarina sp.]|uniref:methionyl-tRNA formyltransferase n=1 Tax=uncultured Aquimarina sp. TaxID=575652 RepID=UPI00262521C5|nr:formyltransferase family protein [uncultured Aquimarina sp.]